MDSDLIRRIENIRLLALDVDGVLTDGGVYVFEDGTEFRRFNIKDGHGLKRLIEAGIKVAIISSASTKSVVHRAKKLGIEEVHLGVKDKLEILTDLCTRFKIKFDQVAYMGDDLLDLPVMKKVGLPCAPSDACDEILEQAQIVTKTRGGYGAVRELGESLLNSMRYDI